MKRELRPHLEEDEEPDPPLPPVKREPASPLLRAAIANLRGERFYLEPYLTSQEVWHLADFANMFLFSELDEVAEEILDMSPGLIAEDIVPELPGILSALWTLSDKDAEQLGRAHGAAMVAPAAQPLPGGFTKLRFWPVGGWPRAE